MEDELSRPRYRQYIEKRADGSVWRVEEHAYNMCDLLLDHYCNAWEIAHDRGLPLPPPPPPPPQNCEGDDKVVCIKRTETRVGVRSTGADGRTFETSETGMVYAVDSRGERIIDPTFRKRRRPTDGTA